MTPMLLRLVNSELRADGLMWRCLLRWRSGGAAATLLVMVTTWDVVAAPGAQNSSRPASTPLCEAWRVSPHEPVSTDRPDFTESTDIVPRGWFQLEGGYTYARNESADARTDDHTFPELLLRAGLTKDSELRIGWDGLSLTEESFRGTTDVGRPRTFHDHDDGPTDLSVGFKQHLLDSNGLVPDFSLIAALSIPTGKPAKSSGDVDPEVKLLWSYPLREDLAISGNANLAIPSDEYGRFLQLASSVSLAYSISERIGAYLEYFGFYPNAQDEDCAHYVNGGFTLAMNQHLQFDIRVGAGLNEEADDVFTGFGFAIRF